MNERHKRFAEYYAANPNATEAAKAAGYSEKTARSQGQRMLTNVDIVKYIHELQDQAACDRLASITEVKEMWTAVMRNSKEQTKTRLRAGELLARASGEFAVTSRCQTSAVKNDVEDPEDEAPETIICMPRIGNEEFNAIQQPDGSIIPLQGYGSCDVLIFLPCSAYTDPEDQPETEDTY